MFNKTENNNKLPESPEEFLTEKGRSFLNDLEHDHKLWAQIPLLNYTPLHQLKDSSLVRFRGMIQDMGDPEIYLERYEVKCSADGNGTRIQEGKYRDCLVLRAGEQVNYEAEANVQGERRTLFVVSIPGINSWTLEYEEKCNRRNLPTQRHDHNTSAEHGKKRAAPDDSEMDVDSENHTPSTTNNIEANKRQCTQKAAGNASNSSTGQLGMEYLLNSPIPERPGKACMVKVYNDFDKYTLNSIIDVVGFLSVDPALDASTMDEEMCTGFENANELQAQNPPPSLIPRLHVIAVHHLPHHNPLLDGRLLSPEECAAAQEEAFNMLAIQKDLRMLLTLCLFNDELAADYLLSHLISTVYSRSEMQSIGKFALNVCNLPKETVADYTKKLYDILEMLLPVSHYLPMTLDTMNTAAFVPKKDYETNKLISGLLQLSPHTHLVLDETQLQQGKLEANGVLGIQNIAHLINQQQIKCNFHYYEIDYDVDVPVLVLSEGRSMLPHDFTVPIKTDTKSVELITETLKAAQHYLQPTRLDQFRRFLTKAKISTFSMNPEDSEMIQNDFVEMRKTNVINSADGLHSLLVLSRLLAIARGKEVLDKESWELAKDMEAQRKQRVQELPTSCRRNTRN